MLALALQQIRHRRRILTRSEIIPDVLPRGVQIVEVDLAALDGIHDALRNVITVLGALQAHFGCREVGRIAPVVTEAALDAEHAAQRARACRDGAGTGRADERLRRAVVGSIWVELGRASCRERVCQYV